MKTTTTLMKKIFTLMLGIALCSSMATAKNIFVDPTNGNDNNNGTTWELGVKTLGGAVTIAKTGFATGDNIYVKGGTINHASAYSTATTANYFGSCDLSNTGTTTTRTTTDLDANGIVEPWEFQNATLIYTTANVTALTSITALTISNVGYTFDGFSITHVANNTSTINYLRSINLSAANVNFTNCSLKNSIVSYTGSGYAASAPFEMFLRVVGAKVTNCLIEKNSVTYNVGGTAVLAAYPFITVSGSSSNFSNIIVRNNLVTVNSTATVAVTGANNMVRSMLIGLYPTTAPSTVMKNCVVHNNEMVYNGGTSNVGASVNVYSTDGGDSIINCTIANNKSTNVAAAGMMTPSRATTMNYAVNNVLWNNTAGTSTIANLTTSTTTSAASLITKNFMNGGQTVTENGTTILNNDFSLSASNSTGSNQPLFVNPTSIVGSSLGSLPASDSTIIKQSRWNLQVGSYLGGKGISVASNLTDKAASNFATTRAVGAYENSGINFNTTITVGANGSIATHTNGEVLSSAYGTQEAFTITPEMGYRLISVLYNGVDVLGNMVGDVYTAPALYANATLAVQFDIATALTTVQSSFNCFSVNGSVEVRGASVGEQLSILSVTGTKIKSTSVSNSNMSIAMPQGIYLVKIADKVQKVVVR